MLRKGLFGYHNWGFIIGHCLIPLDPGNNISIPGLYLLCLGQGLLDMKAHGPEI